MTSAFLLLAACAPWDLPRGSNTNLDEPLWDPDVVSAADGVYVRLPYAGGLVRVKTDGTWSEVDLRGASPDRMVLAPDDQTVLAFASWTTCRDDDPKIRYVQDCDSEDLGIESELDVVRDGAVVGVADVPSQYNAFAFDGDRLAVAYLDFSEGASIDVDGVLNLTEAVFLELDTGETHRVPVGFAPENVLFSADGSEALVLSRSKVAVVALTGDDAWTRTVTFPLTLDVDQEVDPDNAVLITNDDGDTDYALVSVAGRSELYVLDLTDESIDIVELEAAPADLYVDTVTNHTLVVYGGRAQLDVIDHDLFEIESYELDEPCTRIEGKDGRVVLYNDSGARYHDVYTFDTTTRTVVEARAENPILELRLTEDGTRAVATLNQEGGGGNDASGFYDQYYGLGIFDLGDEPADPVSLLLEGAPVGLELTSDATSDYALVLMDGVDGLQKVDLDVGTADELLLDEPPLGIDAMPDGTFVVTHDSPLGLLTFVDASTGALVPAAGFATTGIMHRDELPRRAEQE